MTHLEHPATAPNHDLNIGKRVIVVLFMLTTLLLIGAGLWPSIWLYQRYNESVETISGLVVLLLGVLLMFNIGYLIGLLVLRIIIPKHKEGIYPLKLGGKPPRAAAIMMLNMMMAKLRFAPPWAPIFTASLVVIPPFSTIYRFVFGPNPPITTFGDTLKLFDPHLVRVGKRVQFGWGAHITGHIYDNDKLIIRGVDVEDDALIGGDSWLLPGVRVGHHAMVTLGAVVLPNTQIKPYEIWGGVPARKIGDRPKPKDSTGE